MPTALTTILRLAEAWPEWAQEELAALARELDAEVNAAAYRATCSELAGIDRGLADAAAGKFASAEQVEAVLAKHRR